MPFFKSNLQACLFLALCTLLSSCSTTYKETLTAWNEGEGSGLAIKVEDIKVKRKKVVAKVTLINKYNFEVVIPEDSVRVSIDGEGGYLHRSNKRVVLSPLDRSKGNYIFLFDTRTKEAKEITFRLEYVYKGAESTAVVSESTGKARSLSSGLGTIYGGVGTAIGATSTSTKTKTITDERLMFKEGERLKSVQVTLSIPQENN